MGVSIGEKVDGSVGYGALNTSQKVRKGFSSEPSFS